MEEQHEDVKTLYVGNLHPVVTEDTLKELFGKDEVECLRIVRDKGHLYIYAFITFKSRDIAVQKLRQMNLLPFLGYRIKVNWAFQSSRKAFDHHLFVGDLSSDATEDNLYQAFGKKGILIRQAKIMLDPITGRSKGYGFVAVQSQEQADHAIQVMSGEQINSRRIRCGHAQHKNLSEDGDPTKSSNGSNTVVYVGGLPASIDEDKLREAFSGYGQIDQVKLQKKGKYAFLCYQTHDAAQRAIQNMNGAEIDGHPLKCSWGKRASQPQTHMPQWQWVQPYFPYTYPDYGGEHGTPPTYAPTHGHAVRHPPPSHVPHVYVPVPHMHPQHPMYSSWHMPYPPPAMNPPNLGPPPRGPRGQPMPPMPHGSAPIARLGHNPEHQQLGRGMPPSGHVASTHYRQDLQGYSQPWHGDPQGGHQWVALHGHMASGGGWPGAHYNGGETVRRRRRRRHNSGVTAQDSAGADSAQRVGS